MNKTLKKNQAAALRFVNIVRKALKKAPIRKLVNGVPQNACECSLTRSIDEVGIMVKYDNNDAVILDFADNSVKAYVVSLVLNFEDDLNNTATKLAVDLTIEKFVRDFDDCKYPELVDIPELVKYYPY